mmetsp:Transcript_13045/g.31494  ORF Transcript_13045/g.31494 Transcript_13045/m.31494 type:complete len:231 (-) Transcript_13045:1080-1772(-)
MTVAWLSAVTMSVGVRFFDLRFGLASAMPMAVSMTWLTAMAVTVAAVTVAMISTLIITLRRRRLRLRRLHLSKCATHASPQGLAFHILLFLTLLGRLLQPLSIGISRVGHQDIVAVPDCIEKIPGLNQGAGTTIQRLHIHALDLQDSVTVLLGFVPHLAFQATQRQIEISNLLQFLGLVFAIFVLPAVQVVELVRDSLVLADRHPDAASFEELPPEIFAALTQGKLVWLR